MCIFNFSLTYDITSLVDLKMELISLIAIGIHLLHLPNSYSLPWPKSKLHIINFYFFPAFSSNRLLAPYDPHSIGFPFPLNPANKTLYLQSGIFPSAIIRLYRAVNHSITRFSRNHFCYN